MLFIINVSTHRLFKIHYILYIGKIQGNFQSNDFTSSPLISLTEFQDNILPMYIHSWIKLRFTIGRKKRKTKETGYFLLLFLEIETGK